jgi:hypothetical protein
LPPSRKTAIAVSVASGCEVAAIAWLLTAAGRLGRWKCLIAYKYPGRKQLRL